MYVKNRVDDMLHDVFRFLLYFYLKSFSPFFLMWQSESSWSNYWDGRNMFFPVFLLGFRGDF